MSVPQFENLRYEVEDGVCWLTIDNEEMRNALTDQIQQDLITAFREIGLDRSIWVVVLTGAGDHAFSSGGDISLFPKLDRVGQWDFMKNRGAEICRLIENLDKPVIAMVNGYCYAGGLELANGYFELVDPLEQRRRFDLEAKRRKEMKKPVYPMDEHFLRALELGLENCAGIALGLDRLVMLLTGAETIDSVVPFTDETL